jgi:hypothetical protein
MSYLYVKWNSLGWGSLADGSVIRAWVCLRWPLPERKPAIPHAVRLGRNGGGGQRRGFKRVLSRRHPGKHRRLRRLHYFRLALGWETIQAKLVAP